MKAGVSLQELAEELHRQNQSKVDYVMDTRRMSISSNGSSTLALDGAEGEELVELAVTEHTHGQLADRLGIPKTFYDRLRNGHQPKRGARKPAQPELFDQLVNGLFQKAPEKRMVRSLDGNARAYVSNRYRRLDNFDLAEAVLPIISDWAEREEARIESCNVTDTRLYMKVVLPKIERTVDRGPRVGDVVQSGFVIQNSEVGLGSLGIFPMIYTLECLNGMVRQREGMREFHIGRETDEGAYAVYSDSTLRADDAAFWMKVQDSVRAAANDAVFEQLVRQLEDAASSEPLADPVGAVEKLGETYGFVESERKSILGHLISGGDLTAYGALNAITRASQEVESYDRASEMEKVGGQILDLSKAEWTALATA